MIKNNIQHVETFGASHHNRFECQIASQLQINHVQRLCRALGLNDFLQMLGFYTVSYIVLSFVLYQITDHSLWTHPSSHALRGVPSVQSSPLVLFSPFPPFYPIPPPPFFFFPFFSTFVLLFPSFFLPYSLCLRQCTYSFTFFSTIYSCRNR